MMYHNIKLAFRNILKDKAYSIVNIVGLTMALTMVMMISLYIKDDLTFDRFHAKGDNIYRLVQDITDSNGEVQYQGNTGNPQGPTFKINIPEIKEYCRLKNGWNTLVKGDEEAFKENLHYVDDSFFDMFSFNTISGQTNHVFNNINNVVITDRIAVKYFKNENPIGKVLNIGDEGEEFAPYTVGAVVAHPPQNSSLQFDLLLSYRHIISTDEAQRQSDDHWLNARNNTFVLLDGKADLEAISKKIDIVTNKYAAPYLKSNNPNEADYKLKFHLQPFYDMHLDPQYFATNGLEYWSDVKYPKILSIIGLLILFLACINYVNLSLAKSMKRLKEIGIRKTIGSSRLQLAIQFIGESFLLTSISILPAFILVHLCLPIFCRLTNKYLDASLIWQPQAILLFVLLLLVIVLLSGLYPAFVLSGLKPIETLKGESKIKTSYSLENILITLQFLIASVFITGIVISAKQFDFIKNTDLGYKTENIIRFWLPWESIEKIAGPLKNELSQQPFVKNISSKSGDFNSNTYEINGKRTDYVYYEDIDYNHLQLMGIKLVTGRYFEANRGDEGHRNIIVNESFVKTYLNDQQDPISQKIKQVDSDLNIIGVVKDFHYNSFKELIKPMVWYLDRGGQAGLVHIELNGNDNGNDVKKIMEIYKKYVPFLPMEYQYLDEVRMQKYEEEQRWRQIINFAGLVSILIACLGLFGLLSFVLEKRTKEIGIRKVLGADLFNISKLISKKFFILISIASLISIPITFYLANNWLQDFAYHISLRWYLFSITIVIVLLLSFITILFKIYQLHNIQPSETLKSE